MVTPGSGGGSRKRTTRHLAEALPQPTQPAIRHARSRHATGDCVAAAGRPPRHATARATPTRIANAAIPARSRRNGHENGCAKRCAHGKRATALRRPPTTGPAPTHAGAAAKRSNDYGPENGRRRLRSPICTEPGRRPAPTPSAAPERPGHNAVVTRTLALRLVICERGRRRSPHTPWPFVSVAATRPSAPGDCWAREATATCACKPPRIGPPASTSTTLATAAKQAYRLIPPEVATIDDGAVPEIGDEQVARDGGQYTCFAMVAVLGSHRFDTIAIVPLRDPAGLALTSALARALAGTLQALSLPPASYALTGTAPTQVELLLAE